MIGNSIQCMVIPVFPHTSLLLWFKGQPLELLLCCVPQTTLAEPPSPSISLQLSLGWLTLSWAQVDSLLGTCMLSCQAGSQTEQKKEAPSTLLLYVTSEVAGWKIITVTFNNLLFLFFSATNFSLFHLWVWQCPACGPFLWFIPGAGSTWASLQAWNNDTKKRRGEKENWGNRALTYSKSHLNIQIGTETLLFKSLLLPCYTMYMVFLVIVCSKISWAWC